jgi:hypothetical protein
MYIDCIDMTDPNVGNDVIQGLNSLSVASTQLQFYGQSNGVAQMVSSVQSALAGATIDVLRIWSHGGSGYQYVSGDGASEQQGDNFACITTDNFTQLGLQKLAPLFSSGAWVELRGCNVGSGGAGHALLLDLASIFGVPVYGGVFQQAGVDWNPPVVCGYPSGAMATTAGPVLNGNQSPATTTTAD